MYGGRLLFQRYARLSIWLFLISLILSPAQTHAMNDNQGSIQQGDALKQAQALSQTADRLYQHVLEGNKNLVQKDLVEVNSLFENAELQKLTTVEGIHALSETIIEMKEAAARVHLDPDDWLTASAKLRMAADSLYNTKQPLWLQYHKLIREELSMMKAETEKGNPLGVKQAYERLQDHYEVIRPAVIIQRKPADVTMIDSWLSYAGGLVNAVSPQSAQIQSMIGQGEEMFNGLFGKKKDYPAMAPLDQVEGTWPWVLWAGAFIVIMLAYTAYRKYRGERDGYNKVTPKWKG